MTLFELVSGLGWYFMGSTIFMAVLLMVTYMWTPAGVFLKAKMRNGIVAEIPRRDNRTEFSLGKYEDGLLRTKYGYQMIADRSIRPEAKSGVALTLAPDGIASTLPPKIIKTINALRNPPYGFSDINEILNAMESWGICNECGYEGMLRAVMIQPDKRKKPEFSHLVCGREKCESKNLQKAKYKINVPLYETTDIGELKKFFIYSMSPRGIEELVSRKVVEETSDQATGMMKWFAIAFAAAILFIGAGIGVTLLMNAIS